MFYGVLDLNGLNGHEYLMVLATIRRSILTLGFLMRLGFDLEGISITVEAVSFSRQPLCIFRLLWEFDIV